MGWFNNVVQTAKSVVSNPMLVNPGMALTARLTPGIKPSGSEGSAAPSATDHRSARESDYNYGIDEGKRIFRDEEMTALRDKQADLAKGYSGEELGALRSGARAEMAGARSNNIRQLAGKAARGGVGGARAAALQGAADQGYQRSINDAERKIALDSGNMVRQGNKDYQDFVMRQKYGELSSGLGQAQLGVSDRSAAEQAAIANKEAPKGLLGQVFGDLF